VNDAEREARIRALLPLVRKIARRISRLVPCDYDDLVGDGSIGLIRAVDNYDPSRGTSLEHYARHLISGAMLNGIRRMDPVSERTRRAMRDGELERYQLAGVRGSIPSMNEMEALRPGFIRASVAATLGVPLSLDRPLPEGERLQRDWSNDPACLIETRSYCDAIDKAVDALPARQRQVIRAHYFGEWSLREVGRRMNISPQRASQLHIVAMRKLRKSLRAIDFDAAAS
jgi:RNA polymerase sigma factor FliA